MTLHNPTTDPPKWSLDQRKMFEALISDYCEKSLNNKKLAPKVRDNLKKQYNITTTYNLTDTQLQSIITTLLSTIRVTEPNYILQTTKQY